MLEVKGISFKYNDQLVLDDISYKFEKGKIYSIVGESGVGKSTFLSVISGLEFSQKGEIFYKNKKVIDFQSYRSEIGYVFQSFNLIPYLSAFDNVRLGAEIHGKKLNSQDIKKNLVNLGITGENLFKKSTELSGGQQQRVAIARAITLDEELIIADEPTGNLDKTNGQQVLNMFKYLKDEDKCIIMVTHDRNLAKKTDVQLTLFNGKLIEQTN